MMSRTTAATLLILFVISLEPARAADDRPGVVSFVKVVSDKIEDVSSMEAWKKSFIKDSMSEEEKALKVWETVVKFRHQNSPPKEFLHQLGCVHDPIKTFNVYGYGMCCCASSNIAALSRYAGLQSRGWAINNHSVPEVQFNNAWHMLDASLVTYYHKSDKSIAGVEDMMANPEGIVNKANCKWVDERGWYPAATHQIQNSVNGYRKKGNVPHLYEYGYTQGYQVNVQLRDGERLTRNWSNKGLHINMDFEKNAHNCINDEVGKGELRYSPKFGDLAPGRIGNGVHEYDVPLASGKFRGGALSVENLASHADDGKSPALHVKDGAPSGTLVMRMPSSYVYLGGELVLKSAVGPGGAIAVSFSDNNGLSWKEIQSVTSSGELKVDLKPLILRRYDYRLKFELKGSGTGLDALKIRHDIQHSQRALPALAQGENKITFSAGPAEGTVSIEGTVDSERKSKQVVLSDFNPVLNNVKHTDILVLAGGKGDITIPISTPGEMTRVRFGGHYRARDAKDAWEYLVSFDEGKTFKAVDTAAGPAAGYCKYVTVADVPAGTKSARVRFSGSQRNTLCMFDIRIDADYKEPQGGFRPVRVTYAWEENGQAKQEVRVCSKPEETFTINCAVKPVMKSLAVELAE